MDEAKAKLLIQKIQASILMLQQIEKELTEVVGGPPTPSVTLHIEESWLGDDGKEHKKSEPYVKSGEWYCCGEPLSKQGGKDGKTVFHCNCCNSNYSN